MDIILERDPKEKRINYKIDIKSLSTGSTKKNYHASSNYLMQKAWSG